MDEKLCARVRTQPGQRRSFIWGGRGGELRVFKGLVRPSAGFGNRSFEGDPDLHPEATRPKGHLELVVPVVAGALTSPPEGRRPTSMTNSSGTPRPTHVPRPMEVSLVTGVTGSYRWGRPSLHGDAPRPTHAPRHCQNEPASVGTS